MVLVIQPFPLGNEPIISGFSLPDTFDNNVNGAS